MKIIRRGARADHGQSTIEFSSPTFSWAKTDKSLVVRQSNVRDFSTAAHHSYALRISSEEVRLLLSALAKAAMDDPEAIQPMLEESLKSLTQLQFIAAGLK